MMLGQRRSLLDNDIMPTAPMTLDVPTFTMPAAAPRKEASPWLGILADALSGAMGRPGQYAAMNNQRRAEQTDFERGERQYQRRRADTREDMLWRQQNEKPASPYRTQDNAGNVWEQGGDGQFKRIFTDSTPKQIIQNGMLINVPNPYAAITGPQAPPTVTPEMWDSAKPMGGPASASPGGFPRYR